MVENGLPATAPDKAADSPGESVIRLMTRISAEEGAVNLSQGFPNEPPPLAVRVALARAVLGLADSEKAVQPAQGCDAMQGSAGVETVEEAVRRVLCSDHVNTNECEDGTMGLDILNQYSAPMGRPDLRQALSDHYERIYSYQVDPECATVTLGATEAVAAALRTIGRPGDRIVIFEPFHEIYPSQCRIFWMEPDYVTLRETTDGEASSAWTFLEEELEDALSGRHSGGQSAKALMLNTPHNPTGKVFSLDELSIIADMCAKYGTYIVTDEIYEHMTYGSRQGKHVLIPKAFPHVADQTFICNSMGKSASATGWRLGWCLHPQKFTSSYRGIHDQMVVMSPHPMQYAALTYFSLPKSYFQETLAERYFERMQALAYALKKVGFGVSEPEGAYYLFVRYRGVPQLSNLEPWDAAMYMVKEVGVACVPGNNFYGSDRSLGCEGKEYLRFAACRSWEDVRGACDRIERALFKE